MEGFLIFLGLVGVLLAIILSLSAWARSSSQAEIIDRLHQSVHALDASNQRLEVRIKCLESPPRQPHAEPQTAARAEAAAPAPAATPAPAPVVAPPAEVPGRSQALFRVVEPEADELRRDLSLAASAPLTPATTLEAPATNVEILPADMPKPVVDIDAQTASTWGRPNILDPFAHPEAPAAVTPSPAAAPPETVAPKKPVTPLPEEPHAQALSSPPAPQARNDAALQPPPKTQAQSRSPAHISPEPEEPSLIERAFVAAKDWLFGGNTLVRMGMVLVFLGLAFLLRYASDRIVIPLELRYLGVAATSLFALFLGWRLREKRHSYALLMQGGAVAVMYLTVFAALKLHDQPLLSTQAGFVLLVAVVALSGVLAVAQNALSLAVAGALGGFATPVLVSTGGGSHVALFSYFALLNAGILGIAWFKAWRPLNLIGFFGTFLIGLAWGLRSYEPLLDFASCEAFLALFFLMFVTIGLLFARRMLLDDPDTPTDRDSQAWAAWFARQGHRAQHYVDGTLLFGTPIMAFGLQVGLIRHVEYGTAFSSLAFGLFYLVLARWAHGANPLRHRLLTEVFLALGMIFASLAIPLALDAQWTSAAWAVEAAGIYWIGQRQNRPLARAFALLLQAGAAYAFLRGIRIPGETHLLGGSALGALMLGLSFLSNALVQRQQATQPDRHAQWDDGLGLIFSSLGLWSLFAIAPMLNLHEGTACAWALAGFAVMFAALQWRLSGWVGNALLVQIVAIPALLGTLHPEPGVLLGGSFSAAVLLGACLLGNAAMLRLHRGARENGEYTHDALLPLFSTLGLWSLYLIAPMQFAAENTACAWALAGMLTVFIGLRLKARGWLANGLLVQLLAGWLFLSRMDHGSSGGVLAFAGSGWKGLVIASLIGLFSLASLGAAIREARRENNPALVTRLAWAMLFGLGFIALAVLFVLPWQTATGVWAGCGVMLMWAAMRLNLKPAFWFALLLEIVAGIAFLQANWFGLIYLSNGAVTDVPRAFAHAGFWTPIVISLAAFAVAWRLHAWSRSPAASEAGALQIDGAFFSLPALLWSAAWWAFGWWQELARLGGYDDSLAHQFLAVMAASVLVLLPIAAKWAWKRLASLSALLLPLTALMACVDYVSHSSLLAANGWLGFGLALAASFGLLRITGKLFETDGKKLLHLVNCWVWLGIASLVMRHVFLNLGEPDSAWRWLGWILPLAAWLLWQSRAEPSRLWPLTTHPQLYRITATLPVLIIQLIWLVQANLHSAGAAAPLPFIPLVNPLDLALVLTLFAAWQWRRQLEAQDPRECGWQPLHAPLQLVLLAGAFLTYTCVVLRGVHHLGEVAWNEGALMASMTAQASLSISWALLALGLMIAGHRRVQRAVWISGAVLIAAVVAKLFFIELSNRGGLERIISFIGVGVLLLVVGYFAPLPPQPEDKEQGPHA